MSKAEDKSNLQGADEILKTLAQLGIGTSKKKKEKSTKESKTSEKKTEKTSGEPDKEKPLIEPLSSDEEDDADDVILEKDLDLKSLDELTKKLSKNLGTGFLDDIDSDTSDEDDDKDDAQFRSQLMEEFRKLKPDTTKIPKQRMKELYIQLLKSGASIMRDKSASDQFLSKLDSKELTEMMNLLQMDPEEIIKYFNNDAEVIAAIKNTPGIPSTSDANGVWDKLNEEDLESSEDEKDDLREKASDEVKKAIKQFEENMLHYTQNPQELLQMSEKLPPKDQDVFLDILFRDYSPAKIKEKLGLASEKSDTKIEKQIEKPKPITDLHEIMDPDLVAHVFKEVLYHFKAFKKNPQKFKPLIDHLKPLEKQAFDALVKAFWDVTIDKLKL